MSEISLAEYARIRGLTRNGVVRAVENGRLKNSIRVEKRQGVRDKLWITDVALANREWEMNTSAKHKPRELGDDAITAAGKGTPRQPRPLSGIPPAERTRAIVEGMGRAAAELRGPASDLPEEYNPTAVDPATGVLPKAISQARREYFDSETARIKSEQLSGKLVDREEVTRAAFNVAREVRDALFLIKDRLSDELATMTDPSKISEYLDKEFRQALTKLAEEISLDGTDAS